MKLMKRKALAFILIIVIVLSSSSWLVYNQFIELQNQIAELQAKNSDLEGQIGEIQNQLNETQNQVSEQQTNLRDMTYELALERPLKVLITNFTWVGDFNPMVGLTISHTIKVTVRNNDDVDVSGLTLTVRLLKKGTLIEVKDSTAFPIQIDQLKMGESREVRSGILATLGSFSVDSAVCAVTLSVRGVVLDEETYNLS